MRTRFGGACSSLISVWLFWVASACRAAALCSERQRKPLVIPRLFKMDGRGTPLIILKVLR